MSPYLYLILSGLLVAFASFAFAAYNMAQHVRNLDDPKPPRFGSMFAKHLSAIVAMAFGGLIAVTGVILAILDYFNLL